MGQKRAVWPPTTSYPEQSGLEAQLANLAAWGPDATGRGAVSVAAGRGQLGSTGEGSRVGRVPSATVLFLLLTVFRVENWVSKKI